MRNLFTYGSLMYSPVWQALVKGHYHQYTASIKGFKRTRILKDTYPVVLPNFTAQELHGVLYKNISEPDLRRLDNFEGAYYKRKTVRVRLTHKEGKIEVVLADIYVLKARYAHMASNVPWDPKQFVQSHIQIFRRCY